MSSLTSPSTSQDKYDYLENTKLRLVLNPDLVGQKILTSAIFLPESFLSVWVNLYNGSLRQIYLKRSEAPIHSGGIKGGMGGGKCPQSEALPPTCPPQSEEKNGQNQPFSANFWIFAPSELHFAPSMPPTKKFLVPPLPIHTCCVQQSRSGTVLSC